MYCMVNRKQLGHTVTFEFKRVNNTAITIIRAHKQVYMDSCLIVQELNNVLVDVMYMHTSPVFSL